VFGAFWEGYLMRETLYLTDDPARRIVGAAGSAVDSLFSRFGAELRSLARAGKRTWIVLSNATIPVHEGGEPPRRLAGFFGAAFPSRISLDYVRSRRENVTTRLRQAAAGSNAVIIDPVEYLCGPEYCPTMAPDSMPMYRDTHHLRSGFVQSRVTFLDRIVER
jgi:hypothetical protein